MSMEQLAAVWQWCACVWIGKFAFRGGGTGEVIVTPACCITSDAFLNRLQKGRVAETDSSLCRSSAWVPPDSGNCTTASFTSPTRQCNNICPPCSIFFRRWKSLCYPSNEPICLCVARRTFIFITEGAGSAWRLEGFESRYNWLP